MASPEVYGSSSRRDAILAAVLTIARSGGYEAVRMRAVAERAGMAVGSLYRYFPSKTHLLVNALTREFTRIEQMCDWSADGIAAERPLTSLTARLHAEWQRDPLLTEAVVRAFVAADASAAEDVDEAASVIEGLMAHAMGGERPTVRDRQIAGLISDVWLANLTAYVGGRLSAHAARCNIDRGVSLLLGVTPGALALERYRL
ncbi:TetR family transcriptional regulator [Mycolicibacterium holsaticum]|uniref:TetR family transcriptional regulator n=1 Tax=Mycolicibacterium holsaticum TaxID=152142 RepID=A0A1E3RIM5_9MYCO|nr:TetR family transcriptional regulator [Mycolicibacterium holsaticum]